MSQNKKYHHWPTLLKAFDESGLTQAQFCQERNINPKYFSTRRRQLLGKEKNSFIKVKLDKPEKAENPSSLSLRLPSGELHFTASVSPSYIASLVRALS